MQKLVDQGHNVIFLANHQTEADPGVFALMLESLVPKMSSGEWGGTLRDGGERATRHGPLEPRPVVVQMWCTLPAIAW